MKRAPVGCLILSLWIALTVNAQPVEYDVVIPEGYTGGRFHGEDVFERREGWQSFDPELMPEVYPSDPKPPPDPVVIMYSPSLVEPEVQELMNIPEPTPALQGEDRIFSEIASDIREQQCFAMGLSRDCDPDTGFSGELTFETESGESVGEEMLGASNFYRRLEAQEEELDIEERFKLLEESFQPDFSPVFTE